VLQRRTEHHQRQHVEKQMEDVVRIMQEGVCHQLPGQEHARRRIQVSAATERPQLKRRERGFAEHQLQQEHQTIGDQQRLGDGGNVGKHRESCERGWTMVPLRCP